MNGKLASPGPSPRKTKVRELFDLLAPERAMWISRNRYFHATDQVYMRFLVPPGQLVLDIGCGDGQLLAGLRPARGVGIDLSPEMVRVARARSPDLEFHVGDVEDATVLSRLTGPFDVIMLSDTVGYLDDIETTLVLLRRLAKPSTRLIVAYYSRAWEPVLRLAEKLGAKMPQVEQNWLSTSDIINMLGLADYDVIRRDWRQLLPKRLFGLGPVVNRYIATLPGIRRLCLRNYVVARPLGLDAVAAPPSVTVVIPCRNERGNIAAALRRLPSFAPKLEIIFVEGHSRDDTYAEIERGIAAHPDRDIKLLRQDGQGKGDAVRKGFEAAGGEIVMILDADLTVPPESLPKFYRALASGKAEFANGTRLVYPMPRGAMRRLNFLANRGFAWIFSFLLNQRFTDTLCGTKALRRGDYAKIAANRHYFGEFDPFGDFDLIFGAARLNLKIVEVPVRYDERSYGETQISRFTHGWLLMRMVLFAWRNLKAL